MTKALPFTKHGLRRAIAAAREEGLAVVGIRPNGDLIIQEKPDELKAVLQPPEDDAPRSKWQDDVA